MRTVNSSMLLPGQIASRTRRSMIHSKCGTRSGSSRRSARKLRARAVLADLNALALQHPDHAHGHSVAVLRAMSTNPEGVSYALQQLQERGHARELGHDVWALTDAGLVEASQNPDREEE